jgi:hypothetical protein
VFEMVKNINVIFGKPVKGIKRKKSGKPPKDSPFKKQSIFFRYLPYWKEFEISHAIDTMHVEKGVFESTIGLLLDNPSKTKDGLSASKDLQALEIREELHPQERLNGRAYLPPGSCTIITEEKRPICKCLHGIRVPTGSSTNIKNMVFMSDCHTMLSRLPYNVVIVSCHCNQSSQSSIFEDGNHTHVPFLQCYIKEANRL